MNLACHVRIFFKIGGSAVPAPHPGNRGITQFAHFKLDSYFSQTQSRSDSDIDDKRFVCFDPRSETEPWLSHASSSG